MKKFTLILVSFFASFVALAQRDLNPVNWSFASNLVRFKIPVRVPYDTDVELASRLLIEVADENEDVLTEPAPTARLLQLGENALQFELRAWSRTRLHNPGAFKSTLNLAIVKKFTEHGISLEAAPTFVLQPVPANGHKTATHSQISS